MIRALYNPQSDITAYELAQIVAFGQVSPTYPRTFSQAQWDALPAGVKRHFRQVA